MDFKIITVGEAIFTQRNKTIDMLKGLKEMYDKYKPYVRVDLVMYGVMILLIILYFIYSVVFE